MKKKLTFTKSDIVYANGLTLRLIFHSDYRKFFYFNILDNNERCIWSKCWGIKELPEMEHMDINHVEVFELPDVLKMVKIIEDKIMPLIINTPSTDDFVDYGYANCWTKETELFLIDKWKNDVNSDKFAVAYVVDYCNGMHCHTTVNYTYKYKFSADSSD